MTDKNSSALLPTVENFPALKILVHMDDFAAGSTIFPARIGGFNLILPNSSGLKDANGYYCTTAMSTEIIADNPLPIFGKGYVLTFASGRARTISGFAGFTGKFGVTGGSWMSTAGLAVADGGNTSNALGVITITTTGQQSGSVGYLDCVSATGPVMYRTVANTTDADVFQAANTMSTGTNFQGMDSVVPGQACELNALVVANDGGRQIMMGLLDLADPLTADELKLIAIWLAFNPRTLPPLLRNRAEA